VVDELFLMGVLDGKDVVAVPDDLIRSLVLRKARFPGGTQKQKYLQNPKV
jgi:hypothetical protein